MRKEKITLAVLAALLCGCAAPSDEEPEPVPAGEAGEYETYAADISGRTVSDAWTAAVNSSYTWTYADETMAIYEMDATLTASSLQSEPKAHLIEYINANGMSSSLDGYYYGGKLYTTYNSLVDYYEEMTFADVKKVLLVPSEPYTLPEDSIESLTFTDRDGKKTYTVSPKASALRDLFLDRYDFYGLSQFDDLQVTSGTITDTFDSDGYFLGEQAVFETEFTYKDNAIRVRYESALDYLSYDTAEVAISDEQKQAQAAYPAFADIDTEAIETADVPDDSEEATVEATLRKRLVNRLGYEQTGDDQYRLTFNDTEGYTFDFANSTFTYSNYSINYVYNWKGGVATMGKCTFIFDPETPSSDCADTTIDMMKKVRDFLRMELYYCGLSFEKLQEETDS